MKLWGSVSGSLLVILVDEGQNIIFGQFLMVHPCLRIMNYDPIHPGPEEPLRVANTEEEEKQRMNFHHNIINASITHTHFLYPPLKKRSISYLYCPSNIELINEICAEKIVRT